jgi:hypothetical protein
MRKNRTNRISKAESLEEMGEFWDTHDFTDFDSDAPDAEFEITCAVPVEIDLLSSVEKQARQRGVSVETLVNLWLQQKLAEQNQATQPAYTLRESPEDYAADEGV